MSSQLSKIDDLSTNSYPNSRHPVATVELLTSVLISLCCLCTLVFRNSLKWDYVYGFVVTIASVFVYFARTEQMYIKPHSALRHCDEVTGLASGGPLLAVAATTFSNGAYAMLAASTWTVVSTGFGMHVKSTLTSLFLYMAAVAVGKEIPVAIPAIVGMAVAPTAHLLVVGCQHTFTLAEAAAVSAAMSAVVAKTLSITMDSEASEGLSVPFQEVAMDRSVTIGLVGCVALWWVCVMPAVQIGNIGRASYKVGFLTAGVILLTYFSVWSLATHAEPFLWMARMLSERGTWPLIMLWIIIISTIVLFVRPDKTGVERAIARKFYHAVALGVFAVGLETDIVVLRLGAVVGLGLLIAGEAARLAGGRYLSRFITDIAGRLVDERDSGAVVVTHIYLLLGCSVITWAAPSLNEDLPKSALIAVCVQDGVAAAIGKRFGVNSWGRRGRTLEGSAGGVFAAVVAAYLWTTLPLHVAIVAAVAAAVVEAFTDQVDNWTVPMTFCMVVSACWSPKLN